MSAAHVSKLIFDTLEPRLMLNADLMAVDLATVDPSQATHDVVTRLVEATSAVETETVSQNRVEVVGHADPSRVLASAPLSMISELSILDGAFRVIFAPK